MSSCIFEEFNSRRPGELKDSGPLYLPSTTNQSPAFGIKHNEWAKERLARLCSPLSSKVHCLRYAVKRLSENWINMDIAEMKFPPSLGTPT